MEHRFNQIKIEKTEGMSGVTPNASLTFIAKYFEQSGLSEVINANIGARKRKGASDSDHIMAMVMSQICGGDAIEHQKYLKSRVGILGIGVPSVTAGRSYLKEFHDIEEDKKRGAGKSYLPEPNEYLSGFEKIHAHVFQTAYRLSPLETITLDQDATLIPTGRPDAYFNYEGARSYQAFNTYCAEYDLMLGTRYSDGNVTAGFQQLEELKRMLSLLPEGVKKVKLRSDSAGYQIDLLKYCAGGGNERFGVIDFAISCDVGDEFKEAASKIAERDWKSLRKDKYDASRLECAEMSYVPNSLSSSKKDPEIRFFAIREVFTRRQTSKKEIKDVPGQKELGFEIADDEITELESGCEGLKKLHLTPMSGKIYKLFGVASNIMDKSGYEIIHWHRARCGKSEQAHDILKNDFGGSHVPSHLFGVNAAWWNIAVLAMNVCNVMKRYFLPRGYESYRMKTLRYVFFTLVGKVVTHSRRKILKIFSGDAGANLLLYALNKLEVAMPCVT